MAAAWRGSVIGLLGGAAGAAATDLSAHELGHNWGASHCSCSSYTMNASITCANQFNPSLTVPAIIAYRDSVSCLDSCGGSSSGACCFLDETCSVETAADCSTLGGSYQGDDTDCGSVICPLACLSDINGDGTVNVTDLLALLAAWGACP